MKNKIYMIASGAAATIAGLVVTASAHATSFFTVPTSVAPALTANVGDTIADPGTLLVIVIAAGLPLLFYVIHAFIGLLPKSRGRRS